MFPNVLFYLILSIYLFLQKKKKDGRLNRGPIIQTSEV